MLPTGACAAFRQGGGGGQEVTLENFKNLQLKNPSDPPPPVYVPDQYIFQRMNPLLIPLPVCLVALPVFIFLFLEIC